MQTEQILESVKQMSLPELEEFVEQVIAIKASTRVLPSQAAKRPRKLLKKG